MKCSIYDKKEKVYEDCMLKVQRKFEKDMKEFCISHYHESGLNDDDEQETVEFYESYHGCLQQGGTKKGKKYCDDIMSANSYSD